jgi:hypothetical protein
MNNNGEKITINENFQYYFHNARQHPLTKSDRYCHNYQALYIHCQSLQEAMLTL